MVLSFPYDILNSYEVKFKRPLSIYYLLFEK